MQYRPYVSFDIPQILLERNMIYHIYFKNINEVNMIHDVITIPNPFPYTAKFMFDGARNNKTQQLRR